MNEVTNNSNKALY